MDRDLLLRSPETPALNSLHSVTRLVVLPQDGRPFDEFVVVGAGGGTFGSGVFAADADRPRTLEGLQERVIVVASEFDLLQLQSLGARLAEAEGLRPEAGYLNSVAVGTRGVDAMAVKSLGRLPLVIQNGADRSQGRRMVEAIQQERNLYTVTVAGTRARPHQGALSGRS